MRVIKTFCFTILTVLTNISVQAANIKSKPVKKPVPIMAIHPLSSLEADKALLNIWFGIKPSDICGKTTASLATQVNVYFSNKLNQTLFQVLAQKKDRDDKGKALYALKQLHAIGLDKFSQEDVLRVKIAIKAGAITGVDPSLLLLFQWNESLWGRKQKQNLSSATGSFQIIESTWFALIKGFDHNSIVSPSPRINHAFYEITGIAGVQEIPSLDRRSLLELRTDPWISTLMAAKQIKQDIANFKAAYSKQPTQAQSYLAWVVGSPTAIELVSMNSLDQETPIDEIMQQEWIVNNPSIFMQSGDFLSIGEIMKKLDKEQSYLYKVFNLLNSIDPELMVQP